MKQPAPIRRIVLSLSLTALFVSGAAELARADHDPSLIHACVKNGNFRIVANPGACKKKGATHITLATAAAVADLQVANNDLAGKLDDLEALTKRLVGNKAAVLETIGFSGTPTGTPGHFEFKAIFCDADDLGQNPCISSLGHTLEWGPITEVDEHAVLTFDAGNAFNWAAIHEILTNGDNDRIAFELAYINPDNSFGGGGGGSGPERTFFFLRPQVSSGVDFTDLEGLEIESISLVLDRVQLFYDQPNDQTFTGFDARIFFNLAP